MAKCLQINIYTSFMAKCFWWIETEYSITMFTIFLFPSFLSYLFPITWRSYPPILLYPPLPKPRSCALMFDKSPQVPALKHARRWAQFSDISLTPAAGQTPTVGQTPVHISFTEMHIFFTRHFLLYFRTIKKC